MAKLVRKTKRLEIRTLIRADFNVWQTSGISLSPKKNRWDLDPRKSEQVSRTAFRKLLALQERQRKADRFYDLGVFEKRTGELVGFVALMEVVRGISHSAYLGYRIFNSHWSKGFGKESARAMIDIAFRDLQLHRIEAGVEPNNRRSILLARSLGLRKEGLKKRAIFLHGEWIDLAMYSTTSEEFGIKWKGKLSGRLS